MPKLLVIADDLSGATDVGVQFAKKGIHAFVILLTSREPPNFAEVFSFYDVVLVDIESRHVSSDEARRRVRLVVEAARSAGVKLFYKKTDSTLRGNVGSELDALLNATGQRTLCFIPAHPLLGRTTRGGIHFVHGKPLHQSTFALDPRNPITESRVATILSRQTTLPLTLIPQSELSAFAKAAPPGLAIIDVDSEAELEHAVEAVRSAGSLNVFAGSAAFASRLAEKVPFARQPVSRPKIPSPLLVVNGSLNEVALRQCTVARENGFAPVVLTPDALFGDGDNGRTAGASIAERASALLADGRAVILASVWNREECATFNSAAARISADAGDWPDRIALSTGRIVAEIFSRHVSERRTAKRDFSLVVFGGDTLAGISKANRWSGFVPRDEPLPGVALSEVPESHLVVLSKPGGFGSDDVLLKLREHGGTSSTNP